MPGRRGRPWLSAWGIACGQRGGNARHWHQAAAGEAAVVARMKELKAGRLSLREIADALNAEKAPTRTGAKWSKMTVKTVLDRAGGV